MFQKFEIKFVRVQFTHTHIVIKVWLGCNLIVVKFMALKIEKYIMLHYYI